MKAENIKKVLWYLKNKTNPLYITILFIFLLFSIYQHSNSVKIENLKTDLLKTQQKLPSQDEKKLIEYKNRIEDSKKKYEDAQKAKKQAEEEMKKHSNFKECFKNQIDRVIDWKESLLDYCDNENQKTDSKKDLQTQKKEPIAQVSVPQKVIRKDWNINDERQKYINYIYDRLWKDALLTFTWENTKWTIDRPSTHTWFDWNRAYWFCQLYMTYHRDFINSQEFRDPYKQLDYCIWVWKDAKKRGILSSTFQAYPWRHKWKYLFDFS